MIRYMGGLGQSSDPERPVLRPGGPAPGARPRRGDHRRDHRARAAPRGARRATRARSRSGPGPGNPDDPKTQTGGVGWILAVDWVPYQLPTFVTPAFPGYVSGHSTFSRAAAEVLTAFTGSEFFPGGVSGYTITAGSLKFETGPDDRRHARVGDLLRRRRPGRASRGSTAASTSRPTTSPAGMIGSRVRQGGLGRWPSATSTGTRRRDRAGRDAAAPSLAGRRSPAARSWPSAVVVGRRRGSSLLGRGARRPRPWAAPRFVDETASVRHRPHLRRRVPRSSSAAGSPSSTATTTAGRTSTSPAAANPAALYRNDERGRRRARASRRSHDPATDLTGVTGAYPLDIDGDGHVDLAVLRVGENVLLRGLGDCRFERANEALGLRRRRRLDDRLQRHVGGRGGAADARRSATTSTLDAAGEPTARLRRQRAAPARRRTGTGYARADRPRARLLHPVDAVQRLGPLRPARPARDQRPPLLPRRRGAAVADGARARRRALYTADDGWVAAADLGHGHRQPRPDRRRLPGGLPRPARATTSCRR